MAGWFANVAERRRIELPEIEGWIEVRSELSVGEKRAMFSRAYKGDVSLASGETRHEYDMSEMSFSQVQAYLVDWSEKADITPDAIKAMSSDVYNHIERAVQKHIGELRKNGHSATTTKKPKRRGARISPSVTT